MRVATNGDDNIVSLQGKLDRERRVQDDRDRIAQWESLGLDKGRDGTPFSTLSNVTRIFQRHERWRNRLWFDDFRDKIFDGEKAWTDADDLAALCWIQGQFGLPRTGLQTVSHAAMHVAYENRRNSVQEWLSGLEWDGNKRLTHWLADCLGASQNDYTAAVGRNWLVSMVARAFKPGCQADHMPVLEGPMGRGKSSALHVLGGEWYQALGQAFGSKEFIEAIQGVWLAEIPDMAGFSRREHSAVIAAVTTRNDHYRASYGRHAEDHPRVTIFAATSETDEYLQDSRGIRRYWPVRCTDINLELLLAMRSQLFAEALRAFKAGDHWYDMPAEQTAAEQIERQQHDVWLESVRTYVEDKPETQVADVLTYALDVERSKQGHGDAMRVAKCLKLLGYSSKVHRTGSKTMRIYTRNTVT